MEAAEALEREPPGAQGWGAVAEGVAGAMGATATEERAHGRRGRRCDRAGTCATDRTGATTEQARA